MLNTRTRHSCQGEISYTNPAGKGGIWLIENQTQHHKADYKRDFGWEKNSLITGIHTHIHTHETSENTLKILKNMCTLGTNTCILGISCKEMNLDIHGQSITKPNKFYPTF